MASQTTTVYDIQAGTPSAIENHGSGTQVYSSVPSLAFGARLQGFFFEFTTTSALTAGSHTLSLFNLPAGCKLLSCGLIVPASAGTTAMSLGTSSDAGLWGTGVDLDTGGAGRYELVVDKDTAGTITTAETTVLLSPITGNFAAQQFQVVGYYAQV